MPIPRLVPSSRIAPSTVAARKAVLGLFSGGLHRTLLWRTLLVSITPLVLLAFVALYVSNSLIHARFLQEADALAQVAAGDLEEKTLLTTRTANLLAALSAVRVLTEEGDVDNLGTFLQSIRSQANVDILNVLDPNGRVIAGVDAGSPDRTHPDTLLQRTRTAQQAWALEDEPYGLTLRATAPVMGHEGDPVGMMEVGVILGSPFLRSMKASSDTELVLAWNGVVKASTGDIDDSQLPTLAEVGLDRRDRLTRTLSVRGEPYLGIFSIVRSQTDNPGLLGVLVPLKPVENANRILLGVLAMLGFGLGAAILTVAYRSAEEITAPVRQLGTATERIQAGDLNTRVPQRSQNEIGTLEAAFNTMAESLGERERERQVHESQLVYMATHDPLTGLPNRHTLEQALTTAVGRAKGGHVSALVYLDLDQFKIVNDTLGHGSGDRLLISIAGLLQANLRGEDLIARLGGDEFAALVHDVDESRALATAEKLRRIVDDYRFREGRRSFEIGVSVGVALVDGRVSGSELLAQADIACYAAKADGRNRVVAYRPEMAAISGLSGDARWSVELKDALREGRFRLMLQPIVRVATGHVDHHEALIRLVEEDGTLTAPGAFIPAAERSGLIKDIDRWVVSAALDEIERRMGREEGHLAVNLSGITLSDPESCDFIQQLIKARQVDPTLLTFEITETALMTNLTRAKRNIGALRSIGCRFALDDFGSGFSSLTYLAELPVDFVKIDGGFVRDVATNPVHQQIVRATATVAHSMGKETIAEWVEDESILEVLRSLGVDLAQGYYIGRPSPTWSSAIIAPARATAEPVLV